MTITMFDRWELRLARKLELLRGRLVRLRGARAGLRFGLGPGIVVRYPACLTVGDDVTIEGPAFLHCLSDRGVRIGSGTSIGRNLWLHCGGVPSERADGSVEIGERSYIGPNGVIGAGGGVAIGSDVLIGPGVVFSSENHIFSDPGRPISEQGVTRQAIVLGDNCWIGSRVVILAGVHIHSGVVVAAGAVVSRDVPADSIAAGVPARVIRTRCGADHNLG